MEALKFGVCMLQEILIKNLYIIETAQLTKSICASMRSQSPHWEN